MITLDTISRLFVKLSYPEISLHKKAHLCGESANTLPDANQAKKNESINRATKKEMATTAPATKQAKPKVKKNLQ